MNTTVIICGAAVAFVGSLCWLVESVEDRKHRQSLAATCILIIATYALIVEVTHVG